MMARSSLAAARLLLFTTATFAFFACDSGPQPGEEASYWGKKLQEGELAKREAAMQHLVQLKDPKSLPFLYDVLKGDVIQLKSSAAQLIAAIGDDTSVEPLLGAVDWNAGAGRDKDSRLAATTNERIAQGLANLGKPGDTKVIETLRRLAGSNHLNTQLAAIVGLGELRAESAVQDLIDIAEGHDNNFMVKNAIIALGNIGDEKAVPVLTKMLFFERGVSFYREASYALFQLGKPAVATLKAVYNGTFAPIEALHIPPGIAKAKALEVLTDIGDPQVIDLAIAANNLAGGDTETVLARAKAQVALGRLGVKSAVSGLMRHWDDVDVSQSEFALAAISHIGDRGAAPALLQMSTHAGYLDQCVTKQQNPEGACRFSEHQVRKVRLEALSRLAGGDIAGAWQEMILDAEKQAASEKDKAAAASGNDKQVAEKAAQGHEKTRDLLKERMPMLDAATECGDNLECWVGKLASENPRVREKAGYELLYRGDQSASAALLKSLADQDNEARYAAILASWRTLPKDGVEQIDAILTAEKGKTQFVRINEDLKRLRVKVARGY
ncbi:MAG: HEAT repeat domain-containing protein [Myxococcota bacterium]